MLKMKHIEKIAKEFVPMVQLKIEAEIIEETAENQVNNDLNKLYEEQIILTKALKKILEAYRKPAKIK